MKLSDYTNAIEMIVEEDGHTLSVLALNKIKDELYEMFKELRSEVCQQTTGKIEDMVNGAFREAI